MRSAPKRVAGYNESSIAIHEGLEGVRNRPGMYLGERGEQMVFRCCKEVVDNCFDEYMAGRNTEIEFFADPKNNTYIIADKAEGIPVGIHAKAKMSTLTVVLTKLHAGGKTTGGEDSAYKSGSVGTHGVGVAAANAVCSYLDAWTHRDGAWHHQSFEKGKPTSKVIKGAKIPKDVLAVLSTKPTRGTIIRIIPDQSIVSVDKGKTPARISVAATANWLKTLALMNANLKITFTANGKSKVYLNKTGIIKMLDDIRQTRELEPMTKPIVIEEGGLSLAIQWTTYADDDGMQSFVSSSPTRDGGTHLDEFYLALTKAITPFKGKRDKYAPKDLRNGLIGVLNYRMSSPEFSSQVKDRLTSNLKLDVYDRVLHVLTDTFSKNKAMVRKIIARATSAKKAKEEFSKVMAGIAQVNSAKRGVMLPNILAMAKSCRPDQRELFLVEGDSSAGTAKKARDSRYQEVLRLTGKPANGVRMDLAKLLQSKPIQNILASLGYSHKAADVYSQLRVERLYLLADADPDGKHINALILTLIWRMLPKLLTDGRVFICDAPLYSAYYKGQRFFGNTFDECYGQMPKGSPKAVVTRAKGWGELPPEVLEIIAFNPKTRNLIKVLPPKDNDEKSHFLAIMGSDSLARKELLGLRG